MTTTTQQQLGRELRTFFILVLMNIVFSALILAFSIQFIVVAARGLAEGEQSVGVAVAMILSWGILFMLGVRWIVSGANIFSGLAELQREYRTLQTPAPQDALTGLIVRMVARYRENRPTVRRMILMGALGGCLFLALGAFNLFEGISAGFSGDTSTAVLSFIGGGINLTLGVISLISSVWFRSYTQVWDQRIQDTARSEEILQETLEKV